jgi:hypothetical protein
LPDTLPGNIGPPKPELSIDEIAVISNCSPSHTPEPTKISPIVPSELAIPATSNTPSSSPTSRDVILSLKINKVDSPVSDIETLK